MNLSAELSLNDAERKEMVERLAVVHRELGNDIRGLASQLWDRQSGASIWSPAQIVEHILLVETRLLQGVENHLGDEPDAGWEQSIAGKKQMLERVIPAEGKAVAPAAVSNFSGLDRLDAVPRLGAGQRRFEEFLTTTAGLPLKALVWTHSIFGPLNARLWLLYIGLHSERHLRQLRRELQVLVAQDAGG